LKHIIFDLDGTLIDSASSIIESMKHALDECGHQPIIEITNAIIGPPLPIALSRVTGIQDVNEINRMISAFKSYYDSNGYQKAQPYADIEQVLQQLNSDGYLLSIATNKRFVPTEKIIQHLSWAKYFKEIYAIDKRAIPFKNKSEMIAVLLQQLAVNPQEAIYVGDRHEDYIAASENSLSFIHAEWGYEEEIGKHQYAYAATHPSKIINIV
jgi:phosphoglycolate phosphatase